MNEKIVDEKLRKDLYNDMRAMDKDIRKAHIKSQFYVMLDNSVDDGYSVLEKLMKKEGHRGFYTLCCMNREDLTVENLILDKYRDRVNAKIVKECEKRIKRCRDIAKKCREEKNWNKEFLNILKRG